jgi:hypothetical protein
MAVLSNYGTKKDLDYRSAFRHGGHQAIRRPPLRRFADKPAKGNRKTNGIKRAPELAILGLPIKRARRLSGNFLVWAKRSG